ncbi:hypothetical protein M885DRAFT_590927 [Pelagophyceae sp. CCMP2097]|nr:hypothetical protein M885DRAFT_590927 [Pelagophyceae sp. CCMP2097]
MDAALRDASNCDGWRGVPRCVRDGFKVLTDRADAERTAHANDRVVLRQAALAVQQQADEAMQIASDCKRDFDRANARNAADEARNEAALQRRLADARVRDDAQRAELRARVDALETSMADSAVLQAKRIADNVARREAERDAALHRALESLKRTAQAQAAAFAEDVAGLAADVAKQRQWSDEVRLVVTASAAAAKRAEATAKLNEQRQCDAAAALESRGDAADGLHALRAHVEMLTVDKSDAPTVIATTGAHEAAAHRAAAAVARELHRFVHSTVSAAVSARARQADADLDGLAQALREERDAALDAYVEDRLARAGNALEQSVLAKWEALSAAEVAECEDRIIGGGDCRTLAAAVESCRAAADRAREEARADVDALRTELTAPRGRNRAAEGDRDSDDEGRARAALERLGDVERRCEGMEDSLRASWDAAAQHDGAAARRVDESSAVTDLLAARVAETATQLDRERQLSALHHESLLRLREDVDTIRHYEDRRRDDVDRGLQRAHDDVRALAAASAEFERRTAVELGAIDAAAESAAAAVGKALVAAASADEVAKATAKLCQELKARSREEKRDRAVAVGAVGDDVKALGCMCDAALAKANDAATGLRRVEAELGECERSARSVADDGDRALRLWVRDVVECESRAAGAHEARNAVEALGKVLANAVDARIDVQTRGLKAEERGFVRETLDAVMREALAGERDAVSAQVSAAVSALEAAQAAAWKVDREGLAEVLDDRCRALQGRAVDAERGERRTEVRAAIAALEERHSAAAAAGDRSATRHADAARQAVADLRRDVDCAALKTAAALAALADDKAGLRDVEARLQARLAATAQQFADASSDKQSAKLQKALDRARRDQAALIQDLHRKVAAQEAKVAAQEAQSAHLACLLPTAEAARLDFHAAPQGLRRMRPDDAEEPPPQRRPEATRRPPSPDVAKEPPLSWPRPPKDASATRDDGSDAPSGGDGDALRGDERVLRREHDLNVALRERIRDAKLLSHVTSALRTIAGGRGQDDDAPPSPPQCHRAGGDFY